MSSTPLAPAAPAPSRGVPGLSAARAADGVAAASGIATLALAARVLPTAELARLGVALAAATLLTGVLDAGASTLLAGAGARGRARAVLGSTIGRLPLLPLVAVPTIWASASLHELAVGLAVLLHAAVSAAGLTLYAAVRAGRDEPAEARAKLVLALATPVGVGASVAVRPEAAAAVVGFALGALATVVLLAREARARGAWRTAAPPLPALVAGVPAGALALATVASYRSGTIVLGIAGDNAQTADFTLAAAIGFAALALPAAAAAPLLGRLRGQAGTAARRRAALEEIRWLVLVCLLGAALLSAFARYGVVAVFGAAYAGAAGPLAILALALPLAGAGAAVATVLVAERSVRSLGLQAGATLAVNVAACALLVPRLGADGAAAAAVLAEGVALCVLAALVWADAEPVARARAFALRALRAGAALGAVAGLAWLYATATTTAYGLRLVPGAAAAGAVPAPAPDGTLLVRGAHDGSAASPYLRLLDRLWRAVASQTDASGRPLPDAHRLSLLLGAVGLLAAAATLAAVYAWARREAGRRVARLTLPVLLALLGPTEIVRAGDLSLHGLLYGAYLPQTLATGTLVLALVGLGLQGPWGLPLAAAGVTATFVLDPLGGTVLAGLVAVHGVWRGVEREPGWWRGAAALAAGFAAVRLLPGYDVDGALRAVGIPGGVAVVACVGLALLGRAAPARDLWSLLPDREREAAAARRLAWIGLGVTVALAGWSLRAMERPGAGRDALAWTAEPRRLPLLLLAGAAGLAGVHRLARQSRPVASAWLAGSAVLGCLGALWLPVPDWPRLLLFCQVPLALGVAVVLAELRAPRIRPVVVATLAVSVVFGVAALVWAPDTVTAFRSGAGVPAGRL